MKIALSLTKKPQNEIFIAPFFFMWIKNENPPGKASPPTPSMRVTHPQQRWNTHGEQQPWFKILPPDGAQEKNILAINIQHSNKKEKYKKRINHPSTSKTNTPTHIHANSFKTRYKFIAIYKIQQKETSSAWAAAGKTEWQENNFMELIISVRWIAITTRKHKITTTSKSHSKNDLSY